MLKPASRWLPTSVCQSFEKAFGLVWNETAELYLLNETTHSNLLAQNPTFSFTLGASPSDGNTTVIKLPYAAFDLNYTTTDGTSRYFPLKRADNDTQYTLGRVFLQESYVIADYERKNFTVAQAAFPSDADQEIRSILPPANITAVEMRKSKGLGTAAIAGIAVGAAALFLLLILSLFLLTRKQKRKRQPESAGDLSKTTSMAEKSQTDAEFQHNKTTNVYEIGHGSLPEPKKTIWEMSATQARCELEGNDTRDRAELESSASKWKRTSAPIAIYELPDDQRIAELEHRSRDSK